MNLAGSSSSGLPSTTPCSYFVCFSWHSPRKVLSQPWDLNKLRVWAITRGWRQEANVRVAGAVQGKRKERRDSTGKNLDLTKITEPVSDWARNTDHLRTCCPLSVTARPKQLCSALFLPENFIVQFSLEKKEADPQWLKVNLFIWVVCFVLFYFFPPANFKSYYRPNCFLAFMVAA